MPDRKKEKDSQLSRAEQWLDDVIDPTSDLDQDEEEEDREEQNDE